MQLKIQKFTYRSSDFCLSQKVSAEIIAFSRALFRNSSQRSAFARLRDNRVPFLRSGRTGLPARKLPEKEALAFTATPHGGACLSAPSLPKKRRWRMKKGQRRRAEISDREFLLVRPDCSGRLRCSPVRPQPIFSFLFFLYTSILSHVNDLSQANIRRRPPGREKRKKSACKDALNVRKTSLP